jgi:hypothetical protein
VTNPSSCSLSALLILVQNWRSQSATAFKFQTEINSNGPW